MLLDSFLKCLKENGIEYKTDEKMSEHTSFKIGGCADVFVTVACENELKTVLKAAKECSVPYFILGRGSNLLVSDNGIKGAVISLGGIDFIKTTDNIINCGAGVPLSAVCLAAECASLSGLEFAYGIPGSIGGALYMNAGAYGGQMADVVLTARCMDNCGNILTLGVQEMSLGYRTSIFKQNGLIILSVGLELKNGDKSEIRVAMDDFMCRRKSKQPLEYPSAGSTFKRPEGCFAGALIEKNNLKGFSIGGAQVSEKHAGFVINKCDATAKDVKALMREICSRVLKNDGVTLEPEVIFVGRKEEDED